MFRKFTFLLAILISVAWIPDAGKKNRLEIVFCLDLSGSTNGLIDDLRDNLWHFINYVQSSSPETDLRIGAIGFSRPVFGLENDYVSILCDITNHYDFLSFQLFGLASSVEKGDQLVGSALYTSVNEMAWSRDRGVSKIIFMFGNGRVDLGRYDYHKATDMAVEKNIVVYPVYCVKQNANQKDLLNWYSIAEKTGGEINTMLVTKRTALKRVSADAEWLTEINNDLNDTYIYFTKEGSACYNEMLSADINSLAMSEQFFYARCRYKISDHYQQQCEQWDLVSYLKNNPSGLPEIYKRYLPEQAQRSTLQDLVAAAKLKMERRESIINRMKNKFSELNTDSLAVNPIDSIIFNSVSKYF